VVVHVDGTPVPEEVLPMDTATAATDEVVPDDGSPAPEAVSEVNTSITGGVDAATSASVAPVDGPTSLFGPVAFEEPVEEPEVILGHLPVGAPGDVSLSDAMGMTHFMLNQVHNVLCRERADLDGEWMRLSEWFSLLKKLTTYEKVKVEVEQKYADVMEILLDRQHATINELDAQAQQMLADAKSLYADTEARTNTTIKQELELNVRSLTISE
jgi:hypothetical protein